MPKAGSSSMRSSQKSKWLCIEFQHSGGRRVSEFEANYIASSRTKTSTTKKWGRAVEKVPVVKSPCCTIRRPGIGIPATPAERYRDSLFSGAHF